MTLPNRYAACANVPDIPSLPNLQSLILQPFNNPLSPNLQRNEKSNTSQYQRQDLLYRRRRVSDAPELSASALNHLPGAEGQEIVADIEQRIAEPLH